MEKNVIGRKRPRLITLEDIRGDLHMHSTWSDGRNSIEDMARACQVRGYQYMAIADHSRAVTIAHGLSPQRVRMQWEEIGRVRRSLPDLLILRSLEVDILANGLLDLADDLLQQLDLVVVAVHSQLSMPGARMTDRIVRAISHPAVHILAHPTGRIINRREPCAVDIDEVLRAAAELGVAVEINAQPHRLDLDEGNARRARELGVQIAISTDSHAVGDLGFMTHGVDQAGRAGLEAGDVLNAWPPRKLLNWLDRQPTRT